MYNTVYLYYLDILEKFLLSVYLALFNVYVIFRALFLFFFLITHHGCNSRDPLYINTKNTVGDSAIDTCYLTDCYKQVNIDSEFSRVAFE